MLDATRSAGRYVTARIGWNSIGVALSLTIIAFAGFTLVHLLRDIDPHKIVVALETTSWRSSLAAAGFVCAAYLTYSLYDLFALRTIGRRDIPYAMALLGSFTSYAIGHNLGATVFTAGAVRLRIYSAWGLTLIDIAKIAFVTGLTFWLGNAVMLGLGIAYTPEAACRITDAPPWLARAIALAGLAAIVGYVAWLLPRPRVVGRAGWQVTLPNARLTLAQIGIGILDLSCSALALWTLLPAAPSIDPVTAVVTFVVAILLGFLSHSPGSLGVLEAAMLLGLPQFEKEALLASLLLFRLLYFILPLCGALIALALLEWRRLRRQPEDADAVTSSDWRKDRRARAARTQNPRYRS